MKPHHRARTCSQIDRDEALAFAQSQSRRFDDEEPSRRMFAIAIDAIGAPLDAVPEPAFDVAPDGVDLRDDAVSVLRHVDGAATVENLIATVDLRPEALFIALDELVAKGLVRFPGPRR